MDYAEKPCIITPMPSSIHLAYAIHNRTSESFPEMVIQPSSCFRIRKDPFYIPQSSHVSPTLPPVDIE